MLISGLSNMKILYYGPESQKAAELLVKELGSFSNVKKVKKVDNFPLFCALVGINLLIGVYDAHYLLLAPLIILFFAYLEK